MSFTAITDGLIITVDDDDRILSNGTVLVEDTTIAAIGPVKDAGGDAKRVIEMVKRLPQ